MTGISLLFVLLFPFAVMVTAQSKAVKFDEMRSYNCEELSARLDNFAAEVSKSSGSVGFVVVYEGKYTGSGGRRREVLPRFGEAVSRTSEMQGYIWRFRRFPRDRAVFISGGFRESHSVEFWIVPKGEKPIVPTPTLEKINYRGGKPERMCSEQ